MDHQDWNPIILKSSKAKKTIVDKKQIVKINPKVKKKMEFCNS